ncbi:hypothetical protein ANN_27847 [Periplaneta americana]|uniref:Uncharacterized protein n=1 Tax=Periplaneta americana TaxID=6978 RepID=A0ABQ8RVB2_PERAM|nr:hypothetical protein ANN_27847 [Periplaneta americana]
MRAHVRAAMNLRVPYKKPEEDAIFHDNSYGYKVRIKRQDAVTEVPECTKAFVSVHGITKKRREVIQRYLKEGVSPKDRRDILRHHMMKERWNGEKFSPAPGFEPGFSPLRADALSTKPRRIQSRRRLESSQIKLHLNTCMDFGPAFIDIYDVVQRAATRGNPRDGA